jgi:hypothetical protein
LKYNSITGPLFKQRLVRQALRGRVAPSDLMSSMRGVMSFDSRVLEATVEDVVTLVDILRDSRMYPLFELHARRSLCVELVLFWKEYDHIMQQHCPPPAPPPPLLQRVMTSPRMSTLTIRSPNGGETAAATTTIHTHGSFPDDTDTNTSTEHGTRSAMTTPRPHGGSAQLKGPPLSPRGGGAGPGFGGRISPAPHGSIFGNLMRRSVHDVKSLALPTGSTAGQSSATAQQLISSDDDGTGSGGNGNGEDEELLEEEPPGDPILELGGLGPLEALYLKYIAPRAPFEVNVSSSMRKECYVALASLRVPQTQRAATGAGGPSGVNGPTEPRSPHAISMSGPSNNSMLAPLMPALAWLSPRQQQPGSISTVTGTHMEAIVGPDAIHTPPTAVPMSPVTSAATPTSPQFAHRSLPNPQSSTSPGHHIIIPIVNKTITTINTSTSTMVGTNGAMTTSTPIVPTSSSSLVSSSSTSYSSVTMTSSTSTSLPVSSTITPSPLSSIPTFTSSTSPPTISSASASTSSSSSSTIESTTSPVTTVTATSIATTNIAAHVTSNGGYHREITIVPGSIGTPPPSRNGPSRPPPPPPKSLQSSSASPTITSAPHQPTEVASSSSSTTTIVSVNNSPAIPSISLPSESSIANVPILSLSSSSTTSTPSLSRTTTLIPLPAPITSTAPSSSSSLSSSTTTTATSVITSSEEVGTNDSDVVGQLPHHPHRISTDLLVANSLPMTPTSPNMHHHQHHHHVPSSPLLQPSLLGSNGGMTSPKSTNRVARRPSGILQLPPMPTSIGSPSHTVTPPPLFSSLSSPLVSTSPTPPPVLPPPTVATITPPPPSPPTIPARILRPTSVTVATTTIVTAASSSSTPAPSGSSLVDAVPVILDSFSSFPQPLIIPSSSVTAATITTTASVVAMTSPSTCAPSPATIAPNASATCTSTATTITANGVATATTAVAPTTVANRPVFRPNQSTVPTTNGSPTTGAVIPNRASNGTGMSVNGAVPSPTTTPATTTATTNQQRGAPPPTARLPTTTRRRGVGSTGGSRGANVFPTQTGLTPLQISTGAGAANNNISVLNLNIPVPPGHTHLSSLALIPDDHEPYLLRIMTAFRVVASEVERLLKTNLLHSFIATPAFQTEHRAKQDLALLQQLALPKRQTMAPISSLQSNSPHHNNLMSGHTANNGRGSTATHELRSHRSNGGSADVEQSVAAAASLVSGALSGHHSARSRHGSRILAAPIILGIVSEQQHLNHARDRSRSPLPNAATGGVVSSKGSLGSTVVHRSSSPATGSNSGRNSLNTTSVTPSPAHHHGGNGYGHGSALNITPGGGGVGALGIGSHLTLVRTSSEQRSPSATSSHHNHKGVQQQHYNNMHHRPSLPLNAMHGNSHSNGNGNSHHSHMDSIHRAPSMSPSSISHHPPAAASSQHQPQLPQQPSRDNILPPPSMMP